MTTSNTIPHKEIEILRGTVILRSGQRMFKGGEQEKIKSTQRKSMCHKGILLFKLKKEEMAQQVKALATKSDSLRWIPGTDRVKWEN